MKIVAFCLLIAVLVLQTHTQPPTTCSLYLAKLLYLAQNNHSQYVATMAPYALLSGKMLDDMGFPYSCLKNPSNNYFTVKLGITEDIEDNNYALTMYYGLCFTAQCDAVGLTNGGGFIIDNLLQNSTYTITSMQFQDIDLNVQTSIGSVIVCVLIVLFIIARMASSFLKWGKLCVSDSEDEAIAVELEEESQDKLAGRMPEINQTFLQRFSLSRAFKNLLIKEDSHKIMSFSLFKIFALPFIAYGYLFYLGNYGAYNYFSFNEEIYSTFYARIAIFAYYIPDIFFFISGFLFSRKLIRIDQNSQNKNIDFLAAIGKKLIKLYPVYIAVILIYWFVTPSLHAGPLWNTYIDQVEQCNSNWWAAFLLIDNWFNNGCFSFAWYVQVEIQFVIILSIVFFIYARKRLAAQITLTSFLITSFILLFTLSGSLPSSVETAISDDAQLYFKSFYSHLFFYLFGAMLAFAFEKQSFRSFVNTYFSQNITVYTTFNVIAFALIVLIISLPGVWTRALQLQLGLCRIGIMLSFLIFFLSSMVQQSSTKTYIHKLSKLTYPIILMLGLIALCGFWGLDTFAYVDSVNLLSTSVTTLLLSIGVGGFVGVVFDFIPFTIKQ